VAEQNSSRSVQMPVGIDGADLKQATRLIGADEPPPLPANSQLKAIGRPAPRIDGRLKVTGAARYTADVRLPGMLFGAMLTSPHPRAKIISIDTSAAEAHPGVKAVHIIERLRGVAQAQGEEKDRYPRVRFAGQPIAGVAATSLAVAEEALRLIKVEYDVQQFVVNLEQAMKPGAPIVFRSPAEQAGTAGGGGGPRGLAQKGNVRGPAVGGHTPVKEGRLAGEVDAQSPR